MQKFIGMNCLVCGEHIKAQAKQARITTRQTQTCSFNCNQILCKRGIWDKDEQGNNRFYLDVAGMEEAQQLNITPTAPLYTKPRRQRERGYIKQKSWQR